MLIRHCQFARNGLLLDLVRHDILTHPICQPVFQGEYPGWSFEPGCVQALPDASRRTKGRIQFIAIMREPTSTESAVKPRLANWKREKLWAHSQPTHSAIIDCG